MSVTSSDNREERVRARAYEIWESEGKAEGHHERHWHEASRQVGEDGDAEESADAEGTAAATPDGGKEAGKTGATDPAYGPA